MLPPTLGAALLCSSWAGSDMWLDPEFDHPLHSLPFTNIGLQQLMSSNKKINPIFKLIMTLLN